MQESDVIDVKVLEAIQMGYEYFATTSDMLSSRFRKVYMALNLHYLDENFNMKNFTIEVKEVFGNHTGDMIKEKFRKSFPDGSYKKVGQQ